MVEIWKIIYGPILNIFKFVPVLDLVKLKRVSKSFRSSIELFFKNRRWTLVELFEINNLHRDRFQDMGLLRNERRNEIDDFLDWSFGKDVFRKILVHYSDQVSSANQIRLLPLYLTKDVTMRELKHFFIFVFGNFPTRHGTRNSGEPYWWGICAKFGEAVTWSFKNDKNYEFRDDMKVGELGKEYRIIDASVTMTVGCGYHGERLNLRGNGDVQVRKKNRNVSMMTEEKLLEIVRNEEFFVHFYEMKAPAYDPIKEVCERCLNVVEKDMRFVIRMILETRNMSLFRDIH